MITEKNMKYCKAKTRKRQNKFDIESMIQQSLCTANSNKQNCAVSLPGFDKSLSCNLCKLKLNTANQQRVTNQGISLAELIEFAQKQFDEDEGRPGMDIAEEIKGAFEKYIEKHEKLFFLKNITADEIYRHFKYGHRQERDVKIKGKLTRILLHMLDISTETMCETKNGTISLNNNNSSLALNIIDKLVRIRTKQNNDW